MAFTGQVLRFDQKAAYSDVSKASACRTSLRRYQRAAQLERFRVWPGVVSENRREKCRHPEDRHRLALFLLRERIQQHRLARGC
jgi:hypothetical protein